MKRTMAQRIHAVLHRRKNTRWRCWPRIIKSYLAKEERADVARLFCEFGIKYTNEMRRLRVAYQIPWGVPFDVRNPAVCPQAGTWNGWLECFKQVWKESTPGEREDFLQAYDPVKRN